MELVLSIVALVLAAASFAYTILKTRREAADRREQIDLVKRQIEAQEQREEAADRPRITVALTRGWSKTAHGLELQ
jgi:hypothetical protein